MRDKFLYQEGILDIEVNKGHIFFSGIAKDLDTAKKLAEYVNKFFEKKEEEDDEE